MTQNIEKTLTETRRHLNKSEPGHKQTVNTLKDTQGYPKYRLDTQGHSRLFKIWIKHSRTLKVIENIDQTLKDT